MSRTTLCNSLFPPQMSLLSDHEKRVQAGPLDLRGCAVLRAAPLVSDTPTSVSTPSASLW